MKYVFIKILKNLILIFLFKQKNKIILVNNKTKRYPRLHCLSLIKDTQKNIYKIL